MMYTQKELINKLTPIFMEYPVKRAALFGSYARGEQGDNSDVDIFLELDFTNNLTDFFYVFWDKLEDAIKLKVDVLTNGSLESAPKRFRDQIFNELKYIYEI